MNHHHKKAFLPIIRNPAYSRAVQRITEALEQNTEHPNFEKIRFLRIAMFGDIDAAERSGKITIPKR